MYLHELCRDAAFRGLLKLNVVQRLVEFPANLDREEGATSGTGIGVGEEILVEMHLRPKIVRLKARAAA